MNSFEVLKDSTLNFFKCPSVFSFASVAGKKEGEGPYGKCFDRVEKDAYFNEKTWEAAESSMFYEAVTTAIKKGKLRPENITAFASGDLLNQCTASGYAARKMGIAHLGLYGACSTMSESLIVASLLVSGGAEYALAATSSHFCASEKQFRFPLEYGAQRSPSSQWTVTGSGAVILSPRKKAPFISSVTIGRVIDAGITDAANMGAAMAPAFCDSLYRHLTALNVSPGNYDAIFSGDLGHTGKKIADDLMKEEYGINIDSVHLDCGCMIFDNKKQDVHSGGSGCGCSAVMLSGYILPQMKKGNLNKVLFISTGALMSPTLSLQGESIPSVAHVVEFTNDLS